MCEIFIDTITCRSEAVRLRKVAEDTADIMSRLTRLAGLTAEVWRGGAANALADSQEYTLKELKMFITLLEEAADSIEMVVAELEQADGAGGA